ncbi:MAG: 16S rRNA (adenine(1518)-N(6)/adenine(1519)-N(6))-dimethyltransferase RsmA [Promethearchaeota archaeon]
MTADPLDLLKRHRLFLKKKRGQCFLTNTNIAGRIVRAAELDPSRDIVIEIGAGLGILTSLLARGAKRVIAYEVDPRFCEILRTEGPQWDNVEIVEGDFLEAPPLHVSKVVSNVPFNISGPLLFKLFRNQPRFESAVLVFQKEFGERLAAGPGDNNFSRISAWINFFSDVRPLFEINRRNYFPVPRVDALALKFTPKQLGIDDEERGRFFSFLRGVFPYKNKKLRNAVYFHLKQTQSVGREWVDSKLDEFQGRGWSGPPAAVGGIGALRDEVVKDLDPAVLFELAQFLHDERISSE